MKSFLCFLLTSGIAVAHHGQDFFLTLDARVPAKKAFSAFATAAAGEDDFTLEAGLLAGLGAGFTIGFSTAFSDADGFEADGITPIIQWSAPLGKSPLRIGAAVSYHFSLASEATVSGHSHGGHVHRRTVPSTSFSASSASSAPRFGGFNPDAPPTPIPVPEASAVDSSPTIHLHDEDYYLGRLIIEYELSHHTRFVGNVIFAGTSNSDLAMGYALAMRHSFTHEWAVGIEGTGDFNTGGYHQIVAGVIHSPRHDLGLRLGVSHGIGNSQEGISGLFGVTWRF